MKRNFMSYIIWALLILSIWYSQVFAQTNADCSQNWIEITWPFQWNDLSTPLPGNKYSHTPPTNSFSFVVRFPKIVKKATGRTIPDGFNRIWDLDPWKCKYIFQYTAKDTTTATFTFSILSKTITYNDDTQNPPSSNITPVSYQSSVANSEQCKDVWSYSTNSSNWKEYNSESTRYINKWTDRADLYFDAGNFPTWCTGVTTCKTLFKDKYQQLVTSYGAPSYSANMEPSVVRQLQKALNDANCGTATDCKFWNWTIKSIMSCEPEKKAVAANTTNECDTCDTTKNKCDESTDNKCVCDPIKDCCGVKLNTNVPFIWNCIQLVWSESEGSSDRNTTSVTEQTAFPVLMMWLTKILVTVILLVSFIAIIVAWVMIASSWWWDWATQWRKLIWSVVAALALLWASWVILRLINPNFFW